MITPKLPQLITCFDDVIALHRYLNHNRVLRDKITEEQADQINALLQMAHTFVHGVENHMQLCYLGACMRSGLFPDENLNLPPMKSFLRQPDPPAETPP